jgi:hypothetical protein
MAAEEERAMATTIAPEKASSDMATVTEMKRGRGQRQREMEG